MDTGLTIRASSGANTTLNKPDAAPVKGDAAPSVTTELPAAKVVAAPASPEASRPIDKQAEEQAAQQARQSDAFIERQMKFDESSRIVVFQAIDKRTGEVLQQIPDTTSTNLRAYLRQAQEVDRVRKSESDSAKASHVKITT